jgi:hypothetical protein
MKNSISIQELINQLQSHIDNGVDPETEVKFSYDYGDHWHTLVCGNINSVDMEPVKYSDYHQMDKLVDDIEDMDKEIIILK